MYSITLVLCIVFCFANICSQKKPLSQFTSIVSAQGVRTVSRVHRLRASDWWRFGRFNSWSDRRSTVSPLISLSGTCCVLHSSSICIIYKVIKV